MRAFLPLILLVACNEQEFSRASTTDEFQQAPSNQVDILWVIDNSVSMINEQAAVALGAEDFTVNLEDTEMDFHLGVITTDVDRENLTAGVLLGSPPVLTRLDSSGREWDYASAFRARVQQGNTGSDQEKGLQAALAALSSPLAYTVNEGFLREGAMLSIVVLSDENDCSDNGALGAASTGEDCYVRAGELTPVTDIVRQIVDLKDGDPVVVSGIVGPDIVDNCEATVPGRRYFTAIELLGGVKADICQTDYSSIMDSLGQVASGILTVFQLSKSAIEDTIEVEMRLEEGAEPTVVAKDELNGWTYIAEYAQIEFHGTAVPPRGALLEVHYEIAGQVEELTTAEDTAAP
ncbi:MAG: hypothetical protein Q8P41_13370 [Pseudomonadota bacterium]|nr:hypothetical protein [Pseudomonadota bacterium]